MTENSHSQPADEPRPLALQKIDAKSPGEFLSEEGYQRLPMPDQDRKEIEERLRKKQHFRVSILESMLMVSLICMLLGLSNLIPFGIYTLSLGVAALLILLGVLDRVVTRRYRNVTLAILLTSYLLSACWLVVLIEGWL